MITFQQSFIWFSSSKPSSRKYEARSFRANPAHQSIFYA